MKSVKGLDARRLGLLIFGLLALVAIAAGCGSSSSSSDSSSSSEPSSSSEADTSAEPASEGGSSDINIAFLAQAADNTYNQAAFSAAKEVASEMGASVTIFDAKFSGPEQVQQVRDAVTSGRYQAMEIMPNDPAGLVPAVEEAISKGIYVGALEYPIGKDVTLLDKPQVEGLSVSVASDSVEGGEVTGEEVQKACKGVDPCKVALLPGSKTAPFEVVRIAALKEKLDEEPNIEVVAETYVEYEESLAEKSMRDILQANDDLDVVVGIADWVSKGAERAIEADGKEVSAEKEPGGDNIVLISYGGSAYATEKVKNGEWWSDFLGLPETGARKVTKTLIEAAEGKNPPAVYEGYAGVSPIHSSNANAETFEKYPDFVGEFEF